MCMHACVLYVSIYIYHLYTCILLYIVHRNNSVYVIGYIGIHVNVYVYKYMDIYIYVHYIQIYI